jgi:hypothetical protein
VPRLPVPLRERPFDWVLLGFFAVNLLFISYVVSLEQIAIADPFHFDYPIWPPKPAIDLVHWWEKTYDPLLLARPPWYRATIWIDDLVFGPFYAVALWAFAKGRDWIRTPAILWAGLMMANVSIILFEEAAGPHASPHFGVVLLANLWWFVFPVLVVVRMVKGGEHPFTAVAAGAPEAFPQPAARA